MTTYECFLTFSPLLAFAVFMMVCDTIDIIRIERANKRDQMHTKR